MAKVLRWEDQRQRGLYVVPQGGRGGRLDEIRMAEHGVVSVLLLGPLRQAVVIPPIALFRSGWLGDRGRLQSGYGGLSGCRRGRACRCGPDIHPDHSGGDLPASLLMPLGVVRGAGAVHVDVGLFWQARPKEARLAVPHSMVALRTLASDLARALMRSSRLISTARRWASASSERC